MIYNSDQQGEKKMVIKMIMVISKAKKDGDDGDNGDQQGENRW